MYAIFKLNNKFPKKILDIAPSIINALKLNVFLLCFCFSPCHYKIYLHSNLSRVAKKDLFGTQLCNIQFPKNTASSNKSEQFKKSKTESTLFNIFVAFL